MDAVGWQGWDFNGRDQGALVQGRWTHLAVTWDGLNVEYYVNGQWTNHATWASTVHTSSARFFIGSNSEYTFESNATAFHGAVDEVWVFDHALSAQDVAAMVDIEETLAPTVETVRLGTTGSGGGLSSWASDDGDLRRICKFVLPNMSAPLVRVDLTYATTKADPWSLDFSVKARMAASGVFRIRQFLQKLGTTGEYVPVADNPIGTTFAVTTGQASGNLSEFVGADHRLVGRIEVARTGLSSTAQPCAEFEYAVMRVSG